MISPKRCMRALAALFAVMIVTWAAAGTAVADDLFTVKGALTWGSNVVLPEKSVAVIQITDPASIDGTPLAEQRLPIEASASSRSFTVQADREDFKPGRNYVLRATILDGATPTWTAPDILLSVRSESVDAGDVQMQPYKAPPASDEATTDDGDLRLQDLQGIEWVVEDINGDVVQEDSTVTITFGVDGKLSGKASCNSYNAGYALDGDKITVTAVAATKMACASELMQQERNFLDILSGASTLYLDDDGALVIQSKDNRTFTARSE